MTNRTMYFGTEERMTWVKAPAFDMNISKVGWGTSSQFLNGGASVRRSVSAHKEYTMSWNLASHKDIAAISDYADGLYGDGLIYFLDPFAIDTNLLPQYWAAPRLGVWDGPVFTRSDLRPTEVATEPNSYGYPTKSAVYTFDTTSDFTSLFVPLPPGYTFHFGAHGSATGTAAVAVSTTTQSPTTATYVNNVANPSLQSNTTGWTASGTGAVLSRLTTIGFSGNAFGRLTSGAAGTLMTANNTGSVFTVAAGEPFAFSAYVRGTVGRTVGIRATWTGASSTAAGSTTLASATAWQRITFTGTVPVGATAVRVDIVQYATGGLVGDVLDFDAVLAERGTSTVRAYFDGGSLPTSVGPVRTRHVWQGAENNSPSNQYVTTTPGSAVALLPSNTSQLTNTTVVGVSGVYISFWGSGSMTLSGMIAQVLPTGQPAPVGNFISGRGHSGCQFAPGSPSEQGYSAYEGLDLKSLTATLIETGAWQ